MDNKLKNIGNNDNKNNNYGLEKSLQRNIELFRNNLLNNDDNVVYRRFKNRNSSLKFCLIFIDGMVNKRIINENIISQLMKNDFKCNSNSIINYIKEEVVIVDDVKDTKDIDLILRSILYGDSVLLIENVSKAIILNTKGWETRSIDEPQSETIVRGPREGFIESLNTNVSLIRRKINSPNLKFQNLKDIGVRTNTKVCIAYMEGIANEKILNEVKHRLRNLDIEGFFSSGTIQDLISDYPYSPFRTIGYSERPDVIASKLLQGRIAILCDGSPVVLTLPFLFIEYFQVNEDYYENFIYASMNRILRVIAFILTISTPAVYVALTTYHKELIPTKLALSIYLAKEGVPFNSAIESVIMIITFEIIREAGIRLPKHIGATVSIVGALVLGDAAVNARFVSAPVVIVIAIAGICELILYDMRSGVIVSRFIFLVLASILGLYGVIFAMMGLVIHLMSIKTFGIPYMLKLIDLNKYDVLDTAIRAPWGFLKYRTRFIAKNRIRIKNCGKRRNNK
ncbi:spore germination protein [Clostridium niameyense]|uniref:Spore germination protein n=1 Tax=Clostridium niameyense TaxID=1622073 RepID=A0A6M0R6H8_9CLOT|nr:spore germination protein [Clostridium niameyense]NEZ45791.1 spore germination protein [Clostridium niameyense]